MSPTSGVLSEAWGLYRAHWRHLILVALVLYVAIALLNALLIAVLGALGAVMAFFVNLVGVFWVQGALVTAIEDLRDGRADLSVGETLRRVLPRLNRISVAGFLAVLGIVVGFILLIVPGLILVTIWILIIPVIVLENARIGEAFGRSRELVRGYGWKVFGVIVLTVLILIAVGILLGLAGLVLTPFPEWLQRFISNVVSSSLTAPFVALAWTLLYYRLRTAKAQPAAAAVGEFGA